MKPEHIVVCSSHTHSGPDLAGFWQESDQGPDRAYLEQLVEVFAETAAQAAAALKPATLSFGMTELPGYTGRSENCSDVVDNSVAILQARDAAGTPIFTLVNYAKHPTLLGSENTLFSADFIAGFRDTLEEHTHAPAIFIQGAIAAVHGGTLGPSGDTEWDRAFNMGAILAATVEAALPTLHPSTSYEIRHASLAATCEMKSDLIKLLRQNMHIPMRHMIEKDGRLWVKEVPVSWHVVGDAEFVGFPGEATPELGLAAKAEMVQPFRFVLGLANDEIGYLVDKESIAKDTSGRLASY